MNDHNQYFFAAPMSLLSGIGHGISVIAVPWWLKSLGFTYSTITMFTIVNSSFGFKFLWVPIFDRIDFGYILRALGLRLNFPVQRKFPIVFCVYMSVVFIFLATYFDPAHDLNLFALCILLGTFWLANGDAVMIAYNFETLNPRNMGITTGAYRIGMFFGSWTLVFLSQTFAWTSLIRVCGILMLLLISCVFFAPTEATYKQKTWSESLLNPYVDLLGRYGYSFLWVILFLILYKAQDRFSAPVNNMFIRDSSNLGGVGFFLLKVFSTFALATSAVNSGSMLDRYNYQKSFLISVMISSINVFTYFIYSLNTENGYFASIVLAVLNYGAFLFFSGNLGRTTVAIAWLVMSSFAVLFYLTKSGFVKLVSEIQLIAAIFLMTIDKITSGMKAAILYSYYMSLCSKKHALSQTTIITSIELATSYLFLQTQSGFFVDSLGWTYFYLINIALAMLPLAMYWKVVNREEPVSFG